MARARGIKPGFFENETLAECSPHARLLYIGLWTLSDRRGILEDRPKRIRAAIFPYESVDIDGLLAELAQHGFIRRYVAGEHRAILIPTFGKHQNPHVKESASDIPAPDEHGASTVQAPDEHSSSPADSLLLITDSGLPLTDSKTNAHSDALDDLPPDFTEFWSRYPKGYGSRKKSYEQWRRIKGDHPAIMAGLDAWLKSERWRKGYVKTCELWLRDRLWENPPPPAPPDEKELIYRAFVNGAAAPPRVETR